MQNEPQLSENMEENLDVILGEMGILQGEEFGPYFQTLPAESKVEKGVKKLKHFLATALEEQRATLLAELESWLSEQREKRLLSGEYYQAFLVVLRDFKKVQEMKGGKWETLEQK